MNEYFFFGGRKCGALHQDYNIKDPKGGSAIILTEPTIQKYETWVKTQKKTDKESKENT